MWSAGPPRKPAEPATQDPRSRVERCDPVRLGLPHGSGPPLARGAVAECSLECGWSQWRGRCARGHMLDPVSDSCRGRPWVILAFPAARVWEWKRNLSFVKVIMFPASRAEV